MKTLAAALTTLALMPAAAAAQAPADLPGGVPPAALAAEPALPAPAAWPFGEGFPRTSGTGRLQDGALLWTDFVYDDHGAKLSYDDQFPSGLQTESPTAYLALESGGYRYADAAARRNGADIFRVGIGDDGEASYWRVDWTTLVKQEPARAELPLAIFTMDTRAGGVAAWPAGANVDSAGIDRALVVSSRRAVLHDLVAGTTQDLGAPAVDYAARSFVVRIPHATLPVAGTWTVRAGAGVSNAAGTALVRPREAQDPNASWLYNVVFRANEQEPDRYNFWKEREQSHALRDGNVAAFAATVDWGALTARTTQPEPQPTGWSNRWYVTSRELGQGVLPESPGPGDVRPNWLGRIQPYGVYVPATYDPADPAPLTWVLHSLGVNHNQYSATAPRMLADLCERRGSICATTLGRAGDGWYFDEAELDFWEVWNRLASAYSLDTERTVLSGYSMGGFATYKLGLSHPHLFADAIVLAGPMTCGVRVAGDLRGGSADPGTPCAESSDTGPLVANGAWLPFHIAHGAADQLVPVTSVVEHIEQFKAAGNRYVFDLFPGEDHMAWSLQDGFGEITKLHGTPVRETTPGKVDYAFYGHWVRDDLGIGPAGAYWLTGLRARDASPGTLARVTGESAAQPDDPHAVVERLPEPIGPEIDPAEQGLGTPGVRTGQDWQTTGPAPAAREELTVAFTNVARATLDLPGAGFAFDRPGRIETTSDGEVDLLLDGLPEDVVVALDGAPVATAPRVALPAGEHVITIARTVATTLTYTGATQVKGSTVRLAARLVDATGAPVAGRTVTFTVAGRELTALTDATGTATTLALVADHGREQAVAARFAGGEGYKPSQTSATLRWGA